MLAAADFDAEEGNADGYNSSVMLWDAGEGGDGPLRSLHDSLTPEVFQCLMRWDHWIEMVVSTRAYASTMKAVSAVLALCACSCR